MDLRLRIRDDLITACNRRLYRRVWLLLNAIAPCVRLLGVMRCLNLLSLGIKMLGKNSRHDDPLQRARDISRIVQVASSRSAFQVACLEKSLVLWYVLAREGIDSAVCMGTQLTTDIFRAHAWVEVEGQVVSQRTDPRWRYVPFAQPISAFDRRRS